MSCKEPHRAIPVSTQTAFPKQPDLDRWYQVAEEDLIFSK